MSKESERDERLKEYEVGMKERVRKWGEFTAPYTIENHLIIRGTFEQEELFGEISDWACIEITSVDPKVGSSVSLTLSLTDSRKLRQILESKEILGEEWNKRQGEIVNKRRETLKKGAHT